MIDKSSIPDMERFMELPQHSKFIIMRLSKLGKTQVWLARECGCSAQHINNILVGRALPSLKLMCRICATLNMEVLVVFKEVFEDAGLSELEKFSGAK